VMSNKPGWELGSFSAYDVKNHQRSKTRILPPKKVLLLFRF
jgi:hypothetical protein